MGTRLPPLCTKKRRRPPPTVIPSPYGPMTVVSVPPEAQRNQTPPSKAKPTTLGKTNRTKKPQPKLSAMDQRILVLFNSKLQRTNQDLWRLHNTPVTRVPAEKHHAAVVIQRMYRGYRERVAVFAFFGPLNQQKALLIQRHYRGFVGRRRAAQQRYLFWYTHARDRVLRLLAERAVQKTSLIQRVYRGYLGRCHTHRVRLAFHTRCAIEIQRLYRGHRGRGIVKEIRFHNAANARAMALTSKRHNVSNCTISKGLHASFRYQADAMDAADAPARTHHYYRASLRASLVYSIYAALCLDGFQLFPTEPLYPFVYSLMLQLEGSSLEVALTYLATAKRLGLSEDHRHYMETKFFYAALQWRPGDATICLAFAIALQCFGLFRRADSFYKQALSGNPHEYNIVRYLRRRAFGEVIFLNFKRYLCVFKMPPNLRVRLVHKQLVLPTTERMGITVYRHNHYAVLVPDTPQRCNHIYLSDDEIAYFVKQLDDSAHDPDTAGSRGQRRALQALTRRRTGAATSLRDASGLHDLKSSVRLTIDHAERLVGLVVFLPVSSPSATNEFLMVIPAVLRWREEQARVSQQYEALVNIQRCAFETLGTAFWATLPSAKCTNFISHCSNASTSNSAVVTPQLGSKQLFQLAHAAATTIQSIWRRELAKRRVVAIRDGNLHLFPVTRVYNRGMELGGRHFLVAIDQSGLSFRFYATDYVSCNVFTGCCPRVRTLQLLCHLRYEYAVAAVGQSVFVGGYFGTVVAVVAAADANDVAVSCRLSDTAGSTCELTLLDAALAIRTAQSTKRTKSPKSSAATPPELYPLPLDEKNIPGLVAGMVPYLALVPTMSIPTRQLQRETNRVGVAVVLPQKGPNLYLPSLAPQRYLGRAKKRLPPMLLKQTPKPYQRTLRVDSSLQSQSGYRYVPRASYIVDAKLDQVPTQPLFAGAVYRQQCPRHFQAFARCRCFLFHVDASAASHLASLDMALRQGRPQDDHSRATILTQEIPNRTGRMWTRPK
ncbi:hypothetical protein ACHHYP_03387 [Achlya hypogyna]|uniref:Uncharacterized protein n=1 Tax=Achlya hypogyna TaxID=1202772 RepID=A0A1V9ZRD7_ACHHY|nr:hypothetical protein ACHHYP_03387 [Achlya hypogyna]